MPEDEKLHVAVQGRAIPFDVIALQDFHGTGNKADSGGVRRLYPLLAEQDSVLFARFQVGAHSLTPGEPERLVVRGLFME